MKPSKATMKDYFTSMILYLLVFGASLANQKYNYELIAFSFAMSVLYSWRVYVCLFYYWDYDKEYEDENTQDQMRMRSSFQGDQE